MAEVRTHPCKACAEPIAYEHKECPHCGKRQGMSTGLLVALISCGVLVVLCVPGSFVAAIAVPNLLEARKAGNEAAAIGALKTFSTAQTLFREGDKDGDGVYDYATLQELGDADLIDGLLATGSKQGYLFDVRVDPEAPEFVWGATASPVAPGTTGDRFFAVSQEGLVWSDTQSIQLGAGMRIGEDNPTARPVGR